MGYPPSAMTDDEKIVPIFPSALSAVSPFVLTAIAWSYRETNQGRTAVVVRESAPARRCFDGFLPSRSAREQRAKRYFAGWLTEVGNGSTKRKGRIERQFSLNPIEGFLRRNVSERFSRFHFFLGEEFSVIFGILRNDSERSGILRCPQERMEL